MMTSVRQKRMLLAGIIVVVALIGLIIGWRHQSAVFAVLAQWQDYRQYVLDIRRLGPYAVVVFALLMASMAVVPGAPTSAVAVLVGVCLGHWLGFFVNVIGLTLGNLLQAQLFTRVRDHRSQKPDSRLYRWLVQMKQPALGMMIGYAVPMIPTAFVNMAAGDTHLTPRTQALACLAGSTIVAFIYAFAGDLLVLRRDWKTLLVLITIAAVIGLAEYGIKMRKNKAIVH